MIEIPLSSLIRADEMELVRDAGADPDALMVVVGEVESRCTAVYREDVEIGLPSLGASRCTLSPHDVSVEHVWEWELLH